MIKAQRLYNLLMCGALSAAELDLLLERRDYQGALYALRGNEFRMFDLANNPLALEALCHSPRAIASLAEGKTYLDYFFCTETAYAAMAFSDAALLDERIRARVAAHIVAGAWKARARSSGTAKFNDICHAPELGLYIGAGNAVMGVSENLDDWEVSSVSGNLSAVCWSKEKALALAVGNYYSGKSEDARTWTSWNSGQVFNRLYWARRHMLFMGLQNNYSISTSSDAEDWTARLSQGAGYAIVDDGNQYISPSHANGTSYRINTSGDARTWTGTNPVVAKAGPLYDGCFIPERNRVLFVGDGVALIRDGDTWRSRELPSGMSLRSITYSERLKLLAAVGVNVAAFSLDFGDTWILGSAPSRTSPTYDLNALIWDDARRRFVANDKNSVEYVSSHPWELAA